MTIPSREEVEAALKRHEDFMNRESWYDPTPMTSDYRLLARFADAVLNPPTEVREMWDRLRRVQPFRRSELREANCEGIDSVYPGGKRYADIARDQNAVVAHFLALTAPAKETPK